jgi:hypothetical protein
LANKRRNMRKRILVSHHARFAFILPEITCKIYCVVVMSDSNTPFLLSYEQSESASSRGTPSSPGASSPTPSLKLDAALPSAKTTDDISMIGVRKRLLEERVFGSSGTAVASSFPVNASGNMNDLLLLLLLTCTAQIL